jgi:hypothetical protein
MLQTWTVNATQKGIQDASSYVEATDILIPKLNVLRVGYLNNSSLTCRLRQVKMIIGTFLGGNMGWVQGARR